MYTVGCVVGVENVGWSRAELEQDEASVGASGSLRSVVGVDGDGQLQVVGNDPGGLADETSGFVAALGGSEPIMVGGTPYGPEALVAVVLSAIVDVNVAATGVRPDRLAIVHDDDLDPFHTSLLIEAARLAGLATGQVTLVTRSAARDAAPDGDEASGGALVALGALAAAGGDGADGDGAGGGAAAGGGGETALAAGAAGLAAGGVAGFGVHLGDGGVVSAAGPTVGPAGTPITAAGPSGAPMGPTGGSLGPAGPTGSPLGGTGPTGSPLGGTGPTGTPLGSAGPAGSPLDAAGSATSKVPLPKPRPRWFVPAVAGGVVAVVAVAGVVVLAQGDDPPEAAVVVTTTVVAGAEPERAATPAESVDTTQPVVATTEPAVASGWVIAEQIGEVALSSVSCDSELGPWTLTFDQTVPEGTMTGTLLLTFDELGAGTGDYSMVFVVPGEGSVEIGGDQWPARIEPSGDGYTITMETGSVSGVATVDGGSFSFGGDGTSETTTFAVRPATGECGN